MVTGYKRGHKIIFHNGNWVYADNGSPITEERPCARCGKMPTADGHDACSGSIDGVISACCGHGVGEPYVITSNQAAAK